MFRDRLIYRLLFIFLLFSAIAMFSIYAITQYEIEGIKKGANLTFLEKQLTYNLFPLSFYMFFLSFLLSLFLSQKILLPIKELYRGALSIKGGNLIRIPEVKTYDELRKVIEVFNEMSLSLEKKTEDLERTNEAIKSARDFLETIMDSIEDKIVIIDRELKVARVNKAAMKMYTTANPTEEDYNIIGKPCYSESHKISEGCEIDDCPARLVFETGKTYKTIHCHIGGKENKSYYEIVASPVFDQSKDVIYVIEVQRDITERIQYDEELKRKNKELAALNSIAEILSRSLIDKYSIQEAIFRLLNIVEMDDGSILLIDENYNNLVYYLTDRRLPFGDNILSSVIKSGSIHVASDISDSDNLVPEWLKGIGIKSCCCIPLKRMDKPLGVLYLYSTNYHKFTEEEKALLRSAGDMIGIAIESIRLYDELKNLRITEKGLAEMVFNSINDGLYTVDNNFVITSVNRAAEEILGLSSKKIIGKKCADVLSHREPGSNEIICSSYCPLSPSLKGKAITRDVDYIRPDTKRLSLRVSCAPLRNSKGDIIGAVEVFSDVTREREIDRIKTEFVRTVSHEFRTPLSAIVGMTEMLLEDEVQGERAKEYLDTIMKEGKRLASMVTDLLDISRMESAELILNKEKIDFNLLIHDIKKTCFSILNKKSIRLETFIDDKVKCFIGNREMLERLLLNLVSNAINYSDEASKIDINIRKEGNHLLIKVSDTGWGIPDDDIPHMAKKFYRGKHGLKTKGTGLGLALCKEIAKLHGGDISITSRLGKGTTVTVDLPFEGNRDE